MREQILPFLSIPAADWLSDTAALSMAAQGLLFRALAISWRIGPLPAVEDQLARTLGIPRAELKKLRGGLDTYFRLEGDRLVCPRIEAEYRRAMESRKRKREGAARTNEARWGIAKRSGGDGESSIAKRSGSESPLSLSPSSSLSRNPSERVRELIQRDPSANDEQIAACLPRDGITATQVAAVRRSMQ